MATVAYGRFVSPDREGLRGPAVAARVGLWLGTAVLVCFATGLLSHLIVNPNRWLIWPTRPIWLYQFTQGLHVMSGIAAIPLTVVKLWTVWPKFFRRPLIGNLVRLIERLSLLVLVGSVLFQLSTGMMLIANWYPQRFAGAISSHYLLAFTAIGSVFVHVGVKLPVIRQALGAPVDEPSGTPSLSRRTVLRATGVAASIATLVTAGQTIPMLRRLSVLAPRSGNGPQGLPVTNTAATAGVLAAVQDPGYRLTVTNGVATREFTLAELAAMPQTAHRLPIACTEGWSVDAEWTGVVLSDLFSGMGGLPDADLRMISLEASGPRCRTLLPVRHARDQQTLIALKLNGQTLSIDHGYPCRLITPSRPGVLQTKWLSRIEVVQ